MKLDGKNPEFYGILGLNDEVTDMIALGGIFSTVLLPWKDKIVWDGLAFATGANIGPNYFRSFNQDYQEAKKQDKLITNLVNTAIV